MQEYLPRNTQIRYEPDSVNNELTAAQVGESKQNLYQVQRPEYIQVSIDPLFVVSDHLFQPIERTRAENLRAFFQLGYQVKVNINLHFGMPSGSSQIGDVIFYETKDIQGC
jgi:hypothetical protein